MWSTVLVVVSLMRLLCWGIWNQGSVVEQVWMCLKLNLPLVRVELRIFFLSIVCPFYGFFFFLITINGLDLTWCQVYVRVIVRLSSFIIWNFFVWGGGSLGFTATLTLYLYHQYTYSPYCSLYIFYGTGKENLFNNQEFF